MNEQTLYLDQLFDKNKLIPIVILNDIDKAIHLAQALLDSGISTMEITLRTPNALQIISEITKIFPEMKVGAGTILTKEQFQLAIQHGAQYLVSPGLSRQLLEVSLSHSIPFLPGATTPSEIMHAQEYGFNYLKFFPASGFNGYEVLKSLASPFPTVKFCPTGGITAKTALKFLNLPNVVSIGCSFLIQESSLANNNFLEITNFAKKFLASLLINPESK